MEAINHINFPDLSDLQIESLKTTGIKTLMDFIRAPKDVVCSSIEITEDTYHNFRQKILIYLQPHPVTIKQIAIREVTSSKSTGIPSLDEVLGGGLFPGDILELYGNTGTGKTQICMWITAQFCHFGKDDSCVLYFDMKNDFSAKRLLQLCNGVEQSLEKVWLFREANLNRLTARLDDVKNEFTGGINGLYARSRLLIIDSMPSVIYPAVQQSNYSWRFYQEKLLEKIHWLADHLSLSVILVNHAVTTRAVIPSSGGSNTCSTSTLKPAMGRYWQSKITLRIQLSKLTGSKNTFKGILEKCSRLPDGRKFEYSICKDSIQNSPVLVQHNKY